MKPNDARLLEVELARRKLKSLGDRVSTVDAARATGVHQGQVSRILRGQFKRLSPNVQQVLEYASNANTPERPRGNLAEIGERAIIRAALRTWDHTPGGAQALIRLLKSVRDIRRTAKAK